MHVSAYPYTDMTNPNSDEISHLHANLCAALSDPSRILILYALAERSYTVNDLAQAIGATQSATSRHLRILREKGLVFANRQGLSVEYRLADPRLIEALDLLRLILHDSISRRASLLQDAAPAETVAV
jgi:DNA-binding transcriptional ArsR family regulator